MAGINGIEIELYGVDTLQSRVQNVLQSPSVSTKYYDKSLPHRPNGWPVIYTLRIGTFQLHYALSGSRLGLPQ